MDQKWSFPVVKGLKTFLDPFELDNLYGNKHVERAIMKEFGLTEDIKSYLLRFVRREWLKGHRLPVTGPRYDIWPLIFG